MKPVRYLISALPLVFGLLSLAAHAETSDAYSIARGGQLYDKWFKVAENAAQPNRPHPTYPENGAYYGKEGADWRCKECHGWDYKGRDGVYSAGKHHTGIPGIAAGSGQDPAAIVAMLKGETHGYDELNTGLTDRDLLDLARFVSSGQVDMDQYIDRESKVAKGDIQRGQAAFETICANCHGLDGTYDDMMPPVGELANDNPWEVLHKIINGQPDAEMPAMRALDRQLAADILTFAQTLPKER